MNTPGDRTVWDAVMKARMDLAELKGMMTMHLREGEHHHPPCAPAANLQRMMMTAAGASILALLSALGSIVLEFLRH
jgi:hypothetical protein